jgi:hypothetical protein
LSRRREPIADITDEAGVDTLADEARKHLDTIRKGWRHVLDPIDVTSGGSTRNTPRPATEDEADEQLPPDARLDTPLVLAFWVHAALDEWPTILQTLEPDESGTMRLVTTQTIDCSDVLAMTDLLHREADRITSWAEPGHDYGQTFVAELDKVARAVSRVAWPPKGDRICIGECPVCGSRIRVKAPTWHRRPLHVPQPTTDPKRYAEWTWIVPDNAPWEADRQAPITCRCGLEGSIEEWRERIAGPSPLLTAEQLVAEIGDQLGMRYQPASVRQWARRGLVATHGYSTQGHALYDRTQVLAALLAREKARDRAS